MTSFLKLQAIAAARGDGLHPKLLALFEGMLSTPQSGLVPRIDGMIQSGPDPLTERLGNAGSLSAVPQRGTRRPEDDDVRYAARSDS